MAILTTVVGLLNALLSILFPLWPWEPFFVMPFIFECLKPKYLPGVILFLTAFGAIFCLAHGAGAIQAVDTLFLDGEGICVPALPGAPPDIDTTSMCQMMAIHIFMMLAMGCFFTTLVLNPARRVPMIPDLEATYYSRAALFFIIGGVSQDIPYFAVILQYPERFMEFMTAEGFYSKRWCAPPPHRCPGPPPLHHCLGKRELSTGRASPYSAGSRPASPSSVPPSCGSCTASTPSRRPCRLSTRPACPTFH